MAQLFSGDLTGATLVAWHVPGQGWALRQTLTYEYMGAEGPDQVLYDSLTLEELQDVLDALRERLGLEATA